MALVKRNEAEAEADRLFIAGLVQRGGPDFSAVQAWKLLNQRRMKLARETAKATGKQAADAERIAQEARVSVVTVRRDLRIVIGRARDAGTAGAAVFLDDQISAVRDEIEATHLMDEQIMEELERSRGRAFRRQTKRRVPVEVVNPDGSRIRTLSSELEPAEEVRYQEDSAGAAALYARLQESMRRRAQLRAEERMLRFGRQHVPDPEDLQAEEQSIAQALTNMDDPAQAREVLMSLLRREWKSLATTAAMPGVGELAGMEQRRVGTLINRLGTLREYLRLPSGIKEGGGSQVFEVMFQELPRTTPEEP